MGFITKITKKLQASWPKYPFEDLQSSNIFVSSYIVNAVVLVALLFISYFTGDRTAMLEWFYAGTQLFALGASIFYIIKFQKLKKATNGGTTGDREAYLAANYKTAFLFYWVIGLVLSSLLVAAIYLPVHALVMAFS